MAQTTAPLVWDFYREIPGATGLGSTLEYFDESAQAIYLDGGLQTRTTKVEDGHWEDTVLGTEIALTETVPTRSAWDHPATGQLVGVGVEGDEFVIYRYLYAKDVSELVRSGTWKARDDSQIAQASLTLANAGEDVVLADSTLFEPGAKLALAVAMGDSALYPIGTAWLDDVDFDAHSPTFPLSGRNTIGYRLNGQTFDNDTEFTGNGHEVVAWILGLAGVTDYAIGPSDYSKTWTFQPNDTLYKGLQQVFEFFSPWNMLELPDGKIVVGYPAFLAEYQQNSVYQFHGGTEVFRRKTKKAADAAYSKVRVTGKAADGSELTPVLLSVQAFSHWSLGSHKTKHVKAADGMTQAELQAYAEQLAAELAHIGVGESFTGPMRPWLLCGDVASVSWDGQSSMDLGLVTSITHHFGVSGFSTDFAVDSGGVAQITRSAVAVTASAAVNGYNRHQDLADLIGVIGTGKDGKDGAKGEDGDPGEPGASAGFGTPTATVDANTGTPSVQITASGPDTAKVFDFAFHNLKGAQGATGPNEVSSTTNTDINALLMGNGSKVAAASFGSIGDFSTLAGLSSLLDAELGTTAASGIKLILAHATASVGPFVNTYYYCGTLHKLDTSSNYASAILYAEGQEKAVLCRRSQADGWTYMPIAASDVDTAPTENSSNLVTSGGVAAAIANPTAKILGTFSTLAALGTLLDTELPDMANGSVELICVTAEATVYPFYNTYIYTGHLFKIGTSANYSSAILSPTGPGAVPVYCKRSLANGWECEALATGSDVAAVKGFGQPIEIASNTDLDTLTTPGTYYCPSIPISATLINNPAPTKAFSLLVTARTPTASPPRPEQLIIAGTEMFSRTNNSGTWTAWAAHGDTSDLVANQGTIKTASAYASSPNGQLVVTIPNPRNITVLGGFVVLTSYSTSPPKSDLYYLLMTSASYYTRFSTIAANLGLSTISMTYDKDAGTLTINFDTNKTYMQANVYVGI